MAPPKKKVTVVEVGSFNDATRRLLRLRERGFWSFRGQRSETWELGLHHGEGTDETRLRRCFHQFRKRCMEFSRPDYIEEDDDWRWLFYAQHYRLQTRLLDWTSDPLVALYFAVENILASPETVETNPRGAVWALKVRPEHFCSEEALPRDIHAIDEWIMINPPPLNSRIRRQSAKFSFHPQNAPKPLNLIPRREDEELVKVVIGKPGSKSRTADEIRKQLGIMNVHHASLFPDPEGVAMFVNREWPDIALPRTPIEEPRSSMADKLSEISGRTPVTRKKAKRRRSPRSRS